MATVSATDSSVEQAPETAQESEEGQEEEQEEEEEDNKKATPAHIGTVPTCRLYLRLAGLIDIGVEVTRVEQRIGALQKSTQTLEKARARPEYVSKMPPVKQAADANKVTDHDN